MANMLASGMATLGEKMKIFASVTVTYWRGPLSCQLQATIGRMLLKTTDRLGETKTELTDRDFTFKAADLIIDSMQTEPMDGDMIEVEFPEATRQFTVMPFGNEPSWRYADEQGETTIRVHTKHTADL